MPSNFIISNTQPRSGKTTTALNLALCLLTMGKKVQMITLEENNGLLSIMGSYKNDNPLLKLTFSEDLGEVQLEHFEFNLIDCPKHLLRSLDDEIKSKFTAIVPVEMEFYAIQDTLESLKLIRECNINLEGVLPVMVRSGRTSTKVLEVLKERLKSNIFQSFIPRNFYLAKQFDFDFFELEKFTEKAGITYLNLANELIDRETLVNE